MATEVTPRAAGPSSTTSGGAERSGSPAPAGAGGGRARRGPLIVVALLATLVALACAAALPFAPVERQVPVVTWPQAPAAPVTTTLGLVSHAPASLRVETTCATARAAGQRGGDVLFSTMDPTSPRAAREGVLWWVDGEELRLDVAGTTVDSLPMPTGDCTLALVTVPVPLDPRDARPGAGPGTASDAGAGSGLQLRRDGADVGDPVAGMPETDTLATGLTSLDAGAGERLSVALAVNDEFASSPTPLKTALVALLLVAGTTVLVCLGLLDRARRAGRSTTGRTADGRRAPPRWRATLRPRWPDAATVALAVLWTPLAPMTDDDGYYAAMARDVVRSGYVGQYYQLFDQSFVPLTWPWYALSWWQQVADTPLGLRVPALVMVLATWVFLRRSADLLLGDHPRWGHALRQGVPAGTPTGAVPSGVLRSRAVWLLALAYAAAWTPYVMGVRPEAVSALGSAIALVGVLTTVRTGRLLPLALGVVAAAMAAASHPTGAVAISPLVAGLPAAWRAVRVPRLWLTLVRVVLVVAPGAMATAAGFADGTLYDFVRGREVFKAVQTPDAWTDEWIRYGFLLNPDIPMGSYAKRATVLVALLAVVTSLLLVAAARGRRLADDLGARALATAGTTALLGFVALWVTPSKWTHHFGALSALTPLVLLAVLLLGPDLARRTLASRGGGAVGLGVVAAVVAVAAVAMTGQNGWAYSWALGMPRYGVPPYVNVVSFSSPLTWLVVAGAVAAVLGLLARRGRRARPAGAGAAGARPATVGVAPHPSLALRTAAVTTVVLLVVSTGYLVATFAQAAALTAGTYSPQASRLLDPLDRGCGAAGAVSVVDDRRATALAPADVAPPGTSGQTGGTGDDAAAVGGGATSAPAEAFTAGDGGVWVGDPAPPAPGAAQVWGSLAGGNTSVGGLTTGWYDLDGALADPGRRAVTALVTGNLLAEDGNAVVAEYGVLGANGGVRTTTAQEIGDGISSTEWRTVRLGGPVPAPTPERPEPALVTQVLGPDGEPVRYRPRRAEEADVVRLRAVDATTGPGGWVATSAPSVAPMTTMERYLPDEAVVATAWQIAYHFPCQRQVAITRGITDRPAYAVLAGDGPLQGTEDSVWQPGRGGLYSQVIEAATLTRLESGFTDAPGTRWGQLVRIDWPDAADAFDVRLVAQTTSGLDGPTLPDLEGLVPAGP